MRRHGHTRASTRPARCTMYTTRSFEYLSTDPCLTMSPVAACGHVSRRLLISNKHECHAHLKHVSLEQRERASAEYLLVQKLIAQQTEQLTFDLEFISPVDTLITSPYGKKRFINDAPRSPHLATDIRGKEGTPILAPKDGRAVLVANHFYGGNIVILDHGGGLFSSYSHMQKHNIMEGELVKKGTVIGYVGSTGRVTGPHLHWTIYLNENRINPELFIELDYLQD